MQAKNCNTCGSGGAELRCPCKAVLYCNVTCQKAQWKQHRQKCTVHLEKKLREATAELGEEDEEVLRQTFELGMLCFSQDKLAEAEVRLKECLRLLKEVWDYDHPSYHSALANLGMVYRRQGKLEEACNLYRQALPLTERSFGKQSVEAANIIDKIATVLGNMGRAEEARQHYAKAHKIMCRQLGPDHRESIRVKSNMDNTMSSLGAAPPLDFEERERHLAHLKATLPSGSPAEFPEQHNSIVCALLTISQSYLDNGKLEEGKAKVEEGLEFVRKIHTEKHADEGSFLVRLAQYHTIREEWDEALKLVKRASRIFKKTLGADNKQVLECVISSANMLDKLERLDEAHDTYEEGVNICRKYGHNRKIGHLLGCMTKMKLKLDDKESATELLREATRANREYGFEDPASAAMLTMMGMQVLGDDFGDD